MQQPQAILSFSDQLYRRFLRAYPAEYRRGFSEEMAQVFRDLCREVYEREGLAGFLGIWLTTLFDLIKTALEERFKETTNMTREKFVRLSGWALMLAGALIMLGFASSKNNASQFNSPDDPYAQYDYFSDPFGGSDVLYEIAPIALAFSGTLFFAAGMYGLRQRYGERSGNFGNTSLLVSTAAGVVGALATIPMSVLSGDVWWIIWMYSFLIMFSGLFLFGIITVQKRLLPRWNALPLLVGIWFPSIYIVALFDTNLDNLDYLWEVALGIVIVGSLLLGYVLQGDSSEKMVTA